MVYRKRNIHRYLVSDNFTLDDRSFVSFYSTSILQMLIFNQLEEFEKAVRQSYRSRNDDFTMARHRQFVDAIETQISRVETELRESFSKQGNQPLRWVNLNEEECNDLAAFLSGTSGISQTMKDQCAMLGASVSSSTFQEKTCLKNKGCQSNKGISYHTNGSEDVLASNRDASYVINIEATESHETRDVVNCQADRTSGTRRTWSSTEIGTCRIVIPDEDEQKTELLLTTEATPKEKGSKPVCWRKCGDRREVKGGILRHSQLRGVRWINKVRFCDLFSDFNLPIWLCLRILFVMKQESSVWASVVSLCSSWK